VVKAKSKNDVYFMRMLCPLGINAQLCSDYYILLLHNNHKICSMFYLFLNKIRYTLNRELLCV